MEAFQYPQLYNFPPFFTRQPNEETWQKQKEMWISFIKNYCEHQKIHRIDLSEMQQSELFFNKSISRRATPEMIKEIVDEMVRLKQAQWIQAPVKAIIHWKRVDEWADLIMSALSKRGMSGVICTVYELVHGDEYSGEVFYDMDKEVFLKAMEHSQRSGRVQIIRASSTSSIDETGIKIL